MFDTSMSDLNECDYITHLSWSGGIGLGLGSVLLLKVLGSILPGVNFGGLI